jgi:hypothetical protein
MTLQRIISLSLAGMLAIAFAGCVASQPMVVPETVGPPIVRRSVEPIGGRLLVYTATESEHGNSDSEVHSPYEIHAESGELLQRVSNRGPGQTPTPVQLPVGRYRISARALNSGRLEIAIVVEQAKTTTLFLDGSGADLVHRAALSDLVRLPNGLIVGFRAQPE